MRLDERCLADDVAEMLVDADAAIEPRFGEAWAMRESTGDELQQIVVTAARETALDALVDVEDRGDEAVEIFATRGQACLS